MLERANKPRWGLLGIVAAGLCLQALPSANGAPPNVGDLQATNRSLEAKSRAAVLELYALDSKLSRARADLAALQATRARLQAEKKSLATQIQLAKKDTRISEQRLAFRLRSMYDSGTTSSIEVLLGATSLDDAIGELDTIDRIAAANLRVVQQLHGARTRLLTLSSRLETRVHDLATATDALGATVASLGAQRFERTSYISQLATQRSLNAAQIARVEALAQAAIAKSATVTAPPQTGTTTTTTTAGTTTTTTPTTTASPATTTTETTTPVITTPPSGGRTLTVEATAYIVPGTTASGLPVGWGIVAVDPRVIPLGTRIYIPGYGEGVAADTGGAIVGNRIDLWMPTSTQAFAWGRRTVTITIK